MKTNRNLLQLLFLAIIFVFSACNNEDETFPKGDYENGVLISGEGAAGVSTGSVSFVSNDLTTLENLIYKKVNNTEFGTYLQSITFNKDDAFVVVDNQNTITQVDRFTFKKLGTITTDLETPRYIAIDGKRGYVTNWGTSSAFVAVVNLNTNLVEEKITVSNGPERILVHKGNLYVSHKGGFGSNNVISVINLSTKAVQEITVDDKPDEIFISDSNHLIVLCEGNTLYDENWNVIGNTEGSITTINTTNNKIVKEVDFSIGEHPSLLVPYNNNLYYVLNGSIYRISETSSSLSTEALFTSSGFLYGFNISEDNKLFILNANFSDLSTLNIFDLSTKSLLASKEVAIGASKIYFN